MWSPKAWIFAKKVQIVLQTLPDKITALQVKVNPPE